MKANETGAKHSARKGRTERKRGLLYPTVSVALTVALICCQMVLNCIGVAAAATPTKEVHKDCAKCHIDPVKNIKALKTGMNQICLECHPGSKGKDHPIGIVSKVAPPGLPLEEGNKIGCITCHEPHGKNTVGGLLRMEFNSLCRSCHIGV